jgi:hypothetical protein
MNLGKAEASRDKINVRDFKPLGKGLGLLKEGAENNAWMPVTKQWMKVQQRNERQMRIVATRSEVCVKDRSKRG